MYKNNFINFLLSLIFFLLLVLSFNYAKKLQLDASSDTLILQNDQTFEYYKYYNKIFPSKNFLILAIKSKKKINGDYIDNINYLNKQIKQIKNIESTFSIVDAPILLTNNTVISDLSEDNLENINNTKIELDLILKEFSSSPLYSNQIINNEQNLSSIIIYIKKNDNLENLTKLKNNNIKINKKEIIKNYRNEKQKNNLSKNNIISEIRKITRNLNDEYSYSLGGIDMISSDTIKFVKNDIAKFTIAVIIIITFILFIIYREIKWVIIPLFTTLCSVLFMTGLIGYLNWQITAISANFISLMLILSVSMNIHIINHYKLNFKINNIKQSLENTLRLMFWPCFYTILTTIVAFGSLLFSNIKPLEDFGSIMIIALTIILLTSFSVLPILISYFPIANLNNKKIFSLLNNLYKIAYNHSNKIIFLNIMIFIVSIFGIFQLNVENSFINYFKSNTEIHKGMRLIDTELGGTTPIDIIIKFSEESSDIENSSNEKINNSEEELDELDLDELDLDDSLFVDEDETWFSSEKLNTIIKIHQYLESLDEIGKVQSIYSLINVANSMNKKPLSVFELSILYNKIPNTYKELLINPFLSIENNMVRISARVKDSEDIKRNELIQKIENKINSNYDNISELQVNGLLVLYNNMLQSLFGSQIKSFGLIILSIFIMFLILFRSIKLSIIAIIPNIMASLFILGIIGLLKIPLDIMTITIAAITIGIAVDNTIHYIYNIKQNSKKDTIDKLILHSHNNVGNAVLTTSFTISVGFSVLCLSNFIPTILFGAFTSLAMLIAMIGVLVTLPSLLLKIKNDYK